MVILVSVFVLFRAWLVLGYVDQRALLDINFRLHLVDGWSISTGGLEIPTK